ncbi:Uncharacterised protein [Actinobaculum suis]|uniref:TadE-like protein n=1 Tax=Actinobaculum suis TaxID=1657 RepID=A0A7Z8Y822_9ACTO|nr:TadE family type IV pilus minor pilin [Actinobaculum suis]VDG75636.1 Uncharacterised protein [Actinobaculum suis]
MQKKNTQVIDCGEPASAVRWAGKSRRDKSESGMVTVEIALGMLALLSVVILALYALWTAVQYFEVQDASREIAVLAARGRSYEEVSSQVLPSGASLKIDTGSGQSGRALITVEKRAAGPFNLQLRAETLVDLEPGVLLEK